MNSTDRKPRPWQRIDHLDQMIPYLFALGCARAWMTLTFAAPEGIAPSVGFDPHTVFDYAYLRIHQHHLFKDKGYLP